jgi:hypothetical protein
MLLCIDLSQCTACGQVASMFRRVVHGYDESVLREKMVELRAHGSGHKRNPERNIEKKPRYTLDLSTLNGVDSRFGFQGVPKDQRA